MSDGSALSGILQRLEVVASRLETAATSTPAPDAPPVAAAAAPAPAAPEADTAIAKAYDVFFETRVKAVEAAAKDTDIADILEATEWFVEICKYIRRLLVATGSCKKPEPADWQKIFMPVQEISKKANAAIDNRSPFFQNRKSALEAMQIASFATVPGPGQHVGQVLETLDFHAMKVMQKKEPKETAWIKSLKECVKEFSGWCTENCKLGLDWKFGGADPAAFFADGGAAAAPAGKGNSKGKGGAPPPPKAGSAPKVSQATGGGGGGDGPGAGAVMGQIDGFDTSKLKKVSDDMKTKNRPKNEASAGLVVSKAPSPAAAPSGAKGRDAKGPRGAPKFELEKDTNWMVENQEGVQDIKIEEANMSQQVLIINNRNCTIQVCGKVKCISIDGCEKVNLICNDVLANVDLVNSDRVKVQILGEVKSVSIDKCNGVGVYLSKASLDAKIVSSKSSEMNLTIPDPDGVEGEGDIIEMPIPEQFVTTVAGSRKLKTEVSDIYS